MSASVPNTQQPALNVTATRNAARAHTPSPKALSLTRAARVRPGQVEIYLLATPDVTGFFEVEITEDEGETSKQMVHSRMNGDGFVDSQKKMDKIIDALETAVDEAGRRGKL